MWSRIKKIAGIIIAFFSTVFITLFCRSCFNRRRSGGDSDGDRRIKEGIDRAEGRIESCEDHLTRAEGILRNAINRGKEKEGTSVDNSWNQ